MLKIETITVELAYCRCSHDYAGRVRELDDVKRKKHALAKGGNEAVVGWSRECEDIDHGVGIGTHYCS